MNGIHAASSSKPRTAVMISLIAAVSLIAAAAARPRRIQVIHDSGSHHFDAPDLAVLDEERFRHQYARRPVESPELIRTPVRKNTLIHSALIENRVRPNHAALLIDHRVSPVMDVLDHKVVPKLELR